MFRDINPEEIDFEKHASLVVERVLSRGSWDDFRSILNYYGKQRVGEIACQLRCLDKMVLAFCVTYFDIPKENFRCYIQQQLQLTHWNY